jgi:hypothetical protein
MEQTQFLTKRELPSMGDSQRTGRGKLMGIYQNPQFWKEPFPDIQRRGSRSFSKEKEWIVKGQALQKENIVKGVRGLRRRTGKCLWHGRDLIGRSRPGSPWTRNGPIRFIASGLQPGQPAVCAGSTALWNWWRSIFRS